MLNIYTSILDQLLCALDTKGSAVSDRTVLRDRVYCKWLCTYIVEGQFKSKSIHQFYHINPN